MEFLILPAQPSHADALTEIAIAAKRHWNYPERWIQLWLPVLSVSAEYICTNESWIAAVQNKPIAWYSLKQDAEGLWLDNLWVLPVCMGKGIGGKLFSHALERSCIRGASVLNIEADPNAENFYIRMGARRIGKRPSEVDGQPRLLPVLEMTL